MAFSPQKYPVAAIDVFAVAHRAYHNCKKQNDDSDLATVAFPGANTKKSTSVYAALATQIIVDIQEFIHPDVKTLLLFDNPTSKTEGRKQISEAYKKHRQSKPTTFYRTIDFIQFYCTQILPDTVYVSRVPQREADDLIKIFLQDTPSEFIDLQPDQKVLMVANDSDWHACLSDQVDMWWFGMDQSAPYTKQNFINEFSFTPSLSRVALYKALMGDSADNIEAIFKKREISTETLLYIVNTYGEPNVADSLPAVCALDDNIPLDITRKLQDARTTFHVNLKLTDYLPIEPNRLRRYTTRGKSNIVMENTLNSVLKSVLQPEWNAFSFKFGGVATDV